MMKEGRRPRMNMGLARLVALFAVPAATASLAIVYPYHVQSPN
jgi:hypothetical protein